MLKNFHNIFDGQCNSLDAGHQNNEKKLIKNCENGTHAGAASNIIIADRPGNSLGPQHKKNIFRSSCTFSFMISAQNIHTLCEDFHNLSVVMKNIFDGWFKLKLLHIPLPILLFRQPAQSSYHRLCSGLSYTY